MKIKIESLVSSKLAGHSLDDETARWVRDLSEGRADKLAKVGLISPRATQRLKPFLDGYIHSRNVDPKPRTIRKLKTTRCDIVEFFGSDRELREFTPG